MAHTSLHADMDAEARLDTWAETTEDAPVEDLARLIETCGAWLERILPQPVVDAAMNRAWMAMREWLKDPQATSAASTPWRETWADASYTGEFSSLPLPNVFVLLSQYAGYGVISGLEAVKVEDVQARLRALINDAAAFVAAIPAEWRRQERERDDDAPREAVPAPQVVADLPLDLLVLAAEARWCLDARRPLPARGLAALAGGMSLKSIQNAVAAGVLQGGEGMVDADSAAAWLERRPGFLPTLWPQDASAGANADADTTEAAPFEDEPVFVPTHAGSAFLPDLRRRQGYQIGAKGSETYHEDYWQALDHLVRMDKPRWRRPSTGSGVWGIVTCDGWTRLSRKDLQRQCDRAATSAGH